MVFFLIISAGIVAISFSSILIKLCPAPAMVIASYRLGFASLFFGVFCGARRKNPLAKFGRRDLLLAAASGFFLSIHFSAWITSLKYTSVASSVVLVATTPVFVGLSSVLFLREKLSPLLLLGIVLTFLGAVIIGANDFNANQSSTFGNVLALVGALGGTGYLIIGRELRRRIDTTDYVTIVYSITAVLLFATTFLFDFDLLNYEARIFGLLFLIAFVPQVIGHTSFNWALQHASAATVSVLTLGEPIGASILAYLFLGEKITAIELIGGTIILIGVGLALRGELRKKPELPIATTEP